MQDIAYSLSFLSQINSLRFALELEGNIPSLARIFHALRNLDISYDDTYNRYYLRLNRPIRSFNGYR